MTPEEKLKVFREKVNNSTAFDNNFRRLIGIELFEFIRSNNVLKDEFEKRLDYLRNLASDKSFIRLQEDLFETIQKILKLTSLQEVQKRQEEWNGGKNAYGNFLKIGLPTIAGKRNIKEKVFTTLPELYIALQKKENYYRLGEKSPFFATGEEITFHSTTYIVSVRRQYEMIEKFFSNVFWNKFDNDEKGRPELDRLVSDYKTYQHKLYELMYRIPIRLHFQNFERFFFDCVEFDKKEGYEHFYHDFYSTNFGWLPSAEKKFTGTKENALVVIDDLVGALEVEQKTAATPKRGGGGASVDLLYLNAVGDLWREPKTKYCYAMGEKSDRHKIVRHLATNNGYQQTSAISVALDGKSEQSIRTEIAKIRKNIKKFLKIVGKQVIEEGRKGSGYRIDSKYKIKLKKE